MDAGFKDWTIEKSIGEGAFGKVYKIVREDFGHTYEAALKVMEIPQSQAELDSLQNECLSEQEIEEYYHGMVEDIVEEFTLMSKLKGHSNIVSYEDHQVVKKQDGFGWIIYIRMELLTGLFSHAKNIELTNHDVTKLGIDICKALEVCKQYHIIHRDIKPENIFISNVGTYKLGDFGIARELEKTSSGLSQKGTRSYMAPEVYKGMEYNSSVDIYSLGIVLYRFLNDNRLPFLPAAPQKIRYSDKEKADLLRMSGQSMPAPAHASEELARVVLKACAYLPQERYSSAEDMRADLESVLEQEEICSIPFYISNDKVSMSRSTLQTLETDTFTGNTGQTRTGTFDVTMDEIQGTMTQAPTMAVDQTVVHLENASHKKKNAKVWMTVFLGFVVLLAGGSILGYALWGKDSKGDMQTIAGSPSGTTDLVTATPTLEPTKKPTAKPTKKPKKTKKPQVTNKPTQAVTITKVPLVTERPVITKAPIATLQPQRTRSPQRTERPREQSQIIIDDPGVTVE